MLLNRNYLLSFIISHLVFASLHSLDNGLYQYVRHDGKRMILAAILPLASASEQPLERAYSTFMLGSLHIQHAIEEARATGSSLVVCVPNVYSKTYQLGADAGWREGARMALAWSSAAARFDSLGELSLWIVETNDYAEDVDPEKLCHVLENIELNDKRIRTLEDIHQRIICLETFSSDYSRTSLNHLELLTLKPLNTDCQKFPDGLPSLLPNQKRYLITGAAGFLGSHLSELILQQGHQVIGVDNFCCSNNENLARLSNYPYFSFVNWDITQRFDVEGKLDGVVHMASVPSPEFYYRLPKETLQTGIEGTLNCLEIARTHNARFLFTSTSEVYGDPEVSPQAEDYWGNVNPIGPRSQYDQSKRGAETLINLFSQRHGIDCRIARIFNTYGPGMILNDGRVVTNFIQALITNKPMIIHGSGKQTRSFAYYLDTVNGIYSLLTNESFEPNCPLNQRVVNIGSEEEYSINELALIAQDIAKTFFGYESEIIHVSHIDATDPRQRHPDLTRAKQLIGFSPRVSLRDGFIKTLDFFINHVNH